ncbi:MAG: copper resistance CopC/CopD family protein [Chloroflexota bacterium]
MRPPSQSGIASASSPCRVFRPRAREPLGQLVVILALVGLVTLLTPGLALAHAYPVSSDPAPNATLARAPTQIEIAFSDALEPNLSRVTVYNDRKQPVQTDPGRVIPNNPSLIVTPLTPNLPAGSYTVVWHVVAADDGHSTAGVFVFGIGRPAGPPVVSPGTLGVEQGRQATPVGVIGRWLVYLGSVLLLGAAAFALLTGARREVRLAPRLLVLPALAIACLVLGQILRLFDELALSFGQSPAFAVRAGDLGVLLFGSRFGWLWLGRAGLAVVAGLLVAGQWSSGAGKAGDRPSAVRPTAPLARGRRAERSPSRLGLWIACLVVGAGLIADLAWSGHAADGSLLAYGSLIQATLGWSDRSPLYLPIAADLIGAARTLSLAIDWLHLMAVSIWIGGTIALAVATWAISELDLAADRWPSWVGGAVARFSRVATASVVLVLLTGLYNTWLNLAGPESYLTTGYGQSLLLKHAAILALLAMAASNQLVTVPILTRRKAGSDFPGVIRTLLARRPLRTIRIEGGLGVLVLLSTGLLTSLAPARSPQQILLDPPVELALASAPGQAPRVEASDPRARPLLLGARAAMSRLRSARMVESLSDGAGGLSLTEYTFGEPDRLAIVSPDGGAVIQIGSTVYTRQKGSPAWKVEPGATPYLWPTGEFDDLGRGVGATVLGERSLNGQRCVVVAFAVPRSEAIYEDWIGIPDNLIYQEVMVAPSHYMVDQYQDFDRAARIEPPNPGGAHP